MIDVQVARDTSDWVIDIAVAGGTIGAVAVAVWTAISARSEARAARRALADERAARTAADARAIAQRLAVEQARYIAIDVFWDPVDVGSLAHVVGFLWNRSDGPVNAPTVRWLGDRGAGALEQTYKTTLNPDQLGVEPLRFDLGMHPVDGLNATTTRAVCLDFEDLEGHAWRVFPDRALLLRHASDVDVL